MNSIANSAILPDTNEAISFLQHIHPEGPWHLAAIRPEGGGPEAKTFAGADLSAARTWIDARQGKANLYYHVNELRDGVRDAKAKKADVARATHLHVDVDINDDGTLEALRSFAPPPTAIVFSGGGYQALWELSEPVTDLQTVERHNKGVADRLRGDNCHNADRIMRLPGTINLPNAKKVKAGRIPALARIVEADWSRKYSIEEFPSSELEANLVSAPAGTASRIKPFQLQPAGLEQLPESVHLGTRELLELGDDPDRPRTGDKPRYPSRSEAVYHAACLLAKAGCSEELVAGILINPHLGISQSVLEKRNSKAYALRQARAARASVESGWPDCTSSGLPRATMRNALVALRRLDLKFGYDRFRYRKMVNGHVAEEHEGELSDDVCTVLRGEILDRFNFDPGSDNVRDALNQLCLEHSYHPIRDELDALDWDGVPRIDHWLAEYLGAEDTTLNAAIGRIMLIAAVRRVREPGVKFDQIVVLEGPQGSGKSTTLNILAGPGNHSDQEILALDAKTQMELMEGVWIYELSEIEGLKKANVNKMKAFASRQVDRSRMAYGRFRDARPRQVIFVGTTNESKYLRDQTGNRRFWPVLTREIKLEALRKDRNQLWAEAAKRERQGESIELPKELWEAAAIEQTERLEEDPWSDILAAVRGKAFGDVVRVSTAGLYAKLHLETRDQHPGNAKRISFVMQKLGWAPGKYKIGKQTVRGYSRSKPEDHTDDVDL